MLRSVTGNSVVFSVVCAAYNASKYAAKAVESVLKQSYLNWELILVDDGSTDETLDILRCYEMKDHRIKVLHQENMGQMIARMNGVKIASGDFIVFLDADDYLMDDCLFVLSNKMRFFEVCAFNANVISREPKLSKNIPYIGREEELEDSSILDYFFGNKLFGYLWMYCFKKDLILNSDARVEKYRYSEDALFLFSILKNANRALVISDCLYTYNLHSESITHTLTSQDRKDRFLVYNEIYGLNDISVSSDILEMICWSMVSFLSSVSNENDKKNFNKSFKIVIESELFKKVVPFKSTKSKQINIFMFLLKHKMKYFFRIFSKER